MKLYEDDRQLPYPEVLAARASLPVDRSFETYEQALAHINGPPLPLETDLVWEEGLLDVAFAFPIQSDSRVRHQPGPDAARPARERRAALPAAGRRRARLRRARRSRASSSSIRAGIRRRCASSRMASPTSSTASTICCSCSRLVIPFRRLRSLVVVVTSFTIAHSVTLIASAYNLAPDALWFPPLVETLIAVSIVYMAFENIVAARETRLRTAVTRAALEPALGGRVRLRVDPRLRLLVRAARVAAVCGLAPADVAAVVQRRRRARPAAGAA